MLKGDLLTTPLAPLLLELATEDATGCLHISDADGDEALLYLKSGQVYAVTVPGRRPQLGAKLVSSGELTPEALAEALEAQRTELQGWKLGELLVHLGFVEQPVVEAFVREQVHDAVWDLLRWTEGHWRFRKNEKAREDVAPPVGVRDLLTKLRERGQSWADISAVVHGPTAVPVLSTRGSGAAETTLDADAWSMLCKIDGERTVADLARDCGYTLFEAGQVLVTLVQAGLVDIEEDIDVTGPTPAFEDDPEQLYGASSVSSALAAALAEPDGPEDVEGDDIDAIARVVREVAASVREEENEAVRELASVVPIRPVHDDQSFAAAIDRVSTALNDVLGPANLAADPFEVPVGVRRKREAPPKAAPDPEADRRRRLRDAAAAELAAAHALAEALRDEQEKARRAAEEEARRLAAEEEARRLAAEEEAARVAAEEEARLAAEEAARLAAEEEARLAAEETARLAAEEEAARLAAEEEAVRVAAEEEEAARVAAEEEARLAAEEAARLAAEEEAARLAAEEEARLAAEEAARLAAEEEAARLAAEEEARRLAEEEAARLAAEEEARRLAEEEAARLAAEEEVARLAAEEEAARLAAEDDARRLAEEEAARLAEEEAARLAAEEEARRLAAEVAAAEDEAWAEYWVREAAVIEAREEEARRLAAEEEAARQRKAAAASMLAELAAHPAPGPEAEPAPVPAPVEEPAPAPALEPVAAGIGTANRDMADTAALLRELSSLGLDDEAPSTPAPPPRAHPRPAPAADKKKKKRGLFGL